MKIAIAVIALACVVIAMPNAFDSVKPKPLPTDQVEKLFAQFMSKHERIYMGAEKQTRFEIFRSNVEKARYQNALTRDNVYGITKFMDLSEPEFRSTYLMPPRTPEEIRKMMPANTQIVDTFTARDPLPESFDWRTKGAVTPVKNQGACGSCWAFSATGNMEGQFFMKNKKLVSLSEQNLVDCDHECVQFEGQQSCDDGCNGGIMWGAFQHVQKAGGIMTEESYPYEGIDGACRFKNTTIGAKVSGFKMLPTKDEDLAARVAQNGPVAVAINAEYLQIYLGGISDPWICSPTALDHGVLIVGFGKGKTMFGSVVNYWIVKNSWGNWGEQGYFRIAWGKCGINTVPSTAIIA